MRDRLLKTFAGMLAISRKDFQVVLLGAALATSLALISPMVNSADAASQLIHNSTYGGTGKYGVWGQEYTCATCHTKGGTPNIKKINQRIVTPTGLRTVNMNRYTSTSNDTQGILGNDRRTFNLENSVNVCEVCHHRTEYHQYSSSKVAAKVGGLDHSQHKSNKSDCTKCHEHRAAFKRPEADECDVCHGNPPTTISGNGTKLYTNALGDPPPNAGAHDKHRNQMQFECHTCHNNFGHGLLGNDKIEIGFRITSSTWRPFLGVVNKGTFTGTIGGGFNNEYAVAPGNPNTTLLRQAGKASCNIYCHGDNWNVPSGRTGTGVSWTQGPLGTCNNAVCHGTNRLYPPTPVLLSNVSTGAHKTHVGKLGNDDVKCATCHENLPDPHMVNGRVNVNMTLANANLPQVAVQARYNGYVLYSTHTLAASGSYFTCSNLYCHSSVQGSNGTGAPTSFQASVQWGGGYLSCDACHGGQRDNSTPISSGAHAKHITNAYYRYSCDSCHTGAGRSDQLKHADKNIDVAMSASYGGAYSQVANIPGDGFGTCSNVNCHYSKNVGWGDGQLNCNSCHGSDASTLSSGAHSGHISTAANSSLGTPFACSECHAQVVSSNTSVKDYQRHANSFSDYSGRRAGRSYDSASGACANLYCHTDGKGRQNVLFDAGNGWKSGTVYTDCKGCHGNDVAPAFTSLAGEPNYSNANETQPRANSHERHMGGVGTSTCIYCHAGTVNATGVILANSTTHTNRRIDVIAGGTKSFGYNQSTRTCSNITCHGNGSRPVRWGEAFPVDCTGCHGNNAQSFRPLSSGKHTAHVNHNTSIWGRNVRCNTCHALTAGTDDRSILDTSVHGNGFKNFTGVMAGGRGSYTLTTGVCSANYCHSDGKGVQNVPFVQANAWKSTATLDCTGCHGNSAASDFTSVAGEPNYPTDIPGSLRANDHKNHVDFGASTCISCHADTVNSTGVILANASTHVNRRIDVKAGNGKSFTYDAAFKSCTEISCHGGKGSLTQVWGTPVSSDCTGCHGNNAGSSNPINSNKHTAHINNPDIGGNFKCAECHAPTINADDRTFANRQLHGNGMLNYSGVRAGRNYDAAQGNCANSYCHTDGKGVQNASFSLSNGWKSAVTYANCVGCHGNAASPAFSSVAGEPNYSNETETMLRANSHERHMGGLGNTTCVYCHNSTVDAAGALLAGTNHINRTRDVLAGGGKSFGYDPATRTCSNITCHGGVGSAPVSWGKLFPVDCTGCHGNNALAQKQISTGKHKAHTNNKSFLGRNFSCDTCHALTAGADDRSILNTSVHGNGFKNVTGVMSGGRNTYIIADGVCSATYCHTDGKGKRNAPFTSLNGWKSTAKLGCNGCHGNDSVPDFTSVNGEPNYATTFAGDLYANDHKNHVDFGAATCIDCHADTVDTAGNLKQDVNSHLNRSIDVVSGNGKTFEYDNLSKTCSNIYCHGGKGSFSKVWGTPVSANCTGCHGNNVASLLPISSGRHKAHINNAATLGTNFLCADCHALTINPDDRTFANRQLHGNGMVNYSGVRAGRSYDAAQGNCANTYCHTNGKGDRNISFDLATGWKSATVYANCIGCHGNNSPADFTSTAGEPNYVSVGVGAERSNSHKKHVATAGAATCYYCHADVVGVTGTTVNTRHINRMITYSTSNTAGKTFTRGADKTCSNISCHGVGSIPATWGATLDCKGCHGSNLASGSPINTGKHSAHIDNASFIGANYTCAECHAKTVGTDTIIITPANHFNGLADYSGARAGRNYDAGQGNCANTYCHTDGKGTQKVFDASNGWKSTATTNDCTGCHGSASSPAFSASVAGEPNYATAGGNQLYSNSHRSHTAGGTATCVNCHSTTVVGTGAAIIAGAANHINRSIDVFKGGTADFGWDGSTKTCSNISCHSGSNATWGDPNSAGCTTCHGSTAGTFRPISSGKHTAHMNNAVALGTNYLCFDCHAQSVDSNNSIIDTNIHNNTLKNYSGARARGQATYNASTGVCSAAYCHTDGKGRQNVTFTLDNGWKSSATYTGCKNCHGNDATLDHYSSYNGEPNYLNAGQNLPRSNSHLKHVTAGSSTCVLCHADTVTAASVIIPGSTKHTDGAIDVKAGGSASFTGWTDSAKTCSNISCHFNSSAVWGQTDFNCNSCHGGDAATLTSKKHSAHISTTLNPSLGTAIGCAECHARTVNSDNATIKNSAVHINGTMGDYSGARAGTYTAATGACDNGYCHTDGKGKQNVPFNAGNGWNSAATFSDCKGCHGNETAAAFTSAAGEPNYANTGATGSVTSNSHNSHVTELGGAASCDYCHFNTVTTDGLAAKPGGSHLNGNINVDFNRTKEATAGWNGTSRSCSTIACHSGGGATWGDASSVGCKVCHGNLLSKPGVHATHVGDLLDSITFYGYTAIKSSNGVYRIGCANCHPTIEAGNHKNGSVQVTINKDKTGRSSLAGLNSATADGINTPGSGISGTTKVSVTCSMVYCHSSGRSTNQAQNDFRTTPDWYSTAGSVANRCGMCHDNPPQYDGQSHYVATSSMGINGTGPYKDSGHMVGIHFKNTYKGPGGYGFLGYSSAGDKAHGNAGVATTMSCDVCHSGIVDPAKPDTYAMFGTGKKFECASCHTAGTPTKLQAGNIVGTGLHINGKKDVLFTTATYKTKAQLANVANAGGVWMRNGGYKEAGSHDSADLSGSTWDSATKTCLTACHVNQPAIRWGYPIKCSSCHANQ
ncbi:CxxxxCH/CxxCH domain-containing protein [Geobacter sp. OR-1]|uniref:CxxxxCH/CxxCH domain c-type cytochrome n=1 Tax=Geobacter sp. OR-1 TaxID=1266765 RepID=UPI001364BAC4|nr:CxxxxCH/CxxCH domain-containing protein [Geobacter sp. OR-1]